VKLWPVVLGVVGIAVYPSLAISSMEDLFVGNAKIEHCVR